MEKEFTSYELALKLKEVGLSKFEMFGWYINEDGTQFSKSFHKVDSRAFYFNFKYCTKAPLWQQAARFLSISSNNQINISINGEDNYENLFKKLEQAIKDFRDL